MKTTDTEHRTFILTLDADEGQKLAQTAGFTPPSVDVGEREQRQVLKDWAVMDAEGVLPRLMQYASWFTDLVVPEDAPMENRLMANQSHVTFAVAAIARLKARGLIETPANRRLVPVMTDSDGKVVDERLPDELLDMAAEMYEWQHGGREEDESR